ncbi:MAG: hypothetical protein HKN45_07255 [Flavobacteriales bacterium]|nr:hypothetical protein [Flavobacteriales bacterium]
MPSVFLKSDTSITANTEPLVIPKPKVAVFFRPPNGFGGGFGFDWVRKGDTSAVTGDTWYRDIIGSYNAAGTVFTKSNAHYSRLVNKYQKEDHPTKENDKYIVPVVTLMKEKKAKFTLKLDIKKEPVKIEIVFDEDLFAVNQTEITDKAIGKRNLIDFLEVECLEEFDTNQTIEIKADDEFAGRLIFLANDSTHRGYKRIQLVRVQVDFNSDGAVSSPSVSNERGNLRKFLRQSLTTAGIWMKDLDLSSDATMNSTHRTTHPDGSFIVKKTTALATYLETKFAAENPGLENHYKIFFFDERGGRYRTNGSYVGLNGYAKAIVAKSVVLFNTHNSASTIHELLHAMGLYHTFSNSGEFTFEKNKTDNIMDYSHNASPPITRKSTWYWQWKTVNGKLSSI